MNSSINGLFLHALISMPQLKFYRIAALYCIVEFDKVSHGKIEEKILSINQGR